MKKLSHVVLFFLLTCFLFLFFTINKINAATLSSLPFGAVIQIQGTDAQMCNDENCSTYTNVVLPYKFVKMQARTQTGANKTNSSNTYWVMLDNYCWWGSSNCRYQYSTNNNRYASGTSWNSQGNGTTTYTNNLSAPLAQNILIQFSNFYNSLPSTIGGLTKATAIVDNAWDMFGIVQTFGTGTTSAGACASSWTANTQNIGGLSYVFSDAATCTMTSKIALPSYTEWKGGLSAYGAYPTAAGSGYSFCQTRWSKDCANGGSYGLFTSSVGTSSDPRPYYPWLRSASTSSARVAWNVDGGSSTYSVAWSNTYDAAGVLPALWLLGTLDTAGGAGTYADPYILFDECALPENKNKLSCLPMGSVIQIQGTDTTMLNCAVNTQNCGTTTSTVLPYKLVKMQARDGAGNAVSSSNTYWALLDNYCWWGSAKCYFYDGSIRPNYASWNAINSSNFSNNISTPKTYNIMNTMGNFYNSLPSTIGGIAKATAIPDYAWEMRPVSNGNPAVKSGCASGWTANTLAFSGMSATFSDASTCTMTTKIAMLSYDEWQGTLSYYSTYPTVAGSGYSYCQARYGKNCDNGGSYGMFYDESASFGYPIATASNPRPRYPWLRSPDASSANRAWRADGDSSTRSVNWVNTFNNSGVLPALWLSAEISTLCGDGTYADPYHLTGDPCNTPPTISIPTSPTDNPWRSGVAGFTDIIVAGSVTDPDDQNLTIQYQIDETEAANWQTLAVLDETTRTYSVPLNVANQTQGDHTLYLRAFDGIADSEIVSVTFRIDKVAPTISATGASATWGNTQKSAVVTYADPAVAEGSGQSGISRAQYAWGTSSSSITTLLGATCTGGSAIGELGSIIQTPNSIGAHVLYLCAIDNAGNLTTNQGNYYWENTPPTVTQTPSVAVPASGIYTESPIIMITGTDPGTVGVNSSGIANVRYAWDISFNFTDFPLAQGGLAPNWLANNTTISILENGTHTLYYQSRDNAGNVSGVQSVIYNLDTEAPTLETEIITASPETIGNDGWYLSSPTVEISAHDFFGGIQDDSRITKIVTDIKMGEVDPTYAASDSPNNLINHPSETAQITNFIADDSSTQRTVNVSIPANGVYTLYYYSTNISPLNSPIGYLTIQTDSQVPRGYIIVDSLSENRDQVILKYSLTDDYFDPTANNGAGANILSAFTSGLFSCDLQEAVAVMNPDGSTGEFSDFTTILSDCGSPEATNSATVTILSKSLTRNLESGRQYQYQLNLIDGAGNTQQIYLSDEITANHLPILNVVNLSQNQSAFPNTMVSITGTISELDPGETLTVRAEIGGTTKSQTFVPLSPTQAPAFSNQGFTLSWLGSEMVEGVYGNDPEATAPIIISLTDGINEVIQTYQGRIISRSTPEQTVSNDEITQLYNSIYTKEAGALFFLAGTKPNLKDRVTGEFTFTNPQANDFYCYADTNCFNLKPNTLDPEGNTTSTSTQIWYKEIAGKEYPFIIQFYEQPLAESELRINDTLY